MKRLCLLCHQRSKLLGEYCIQYPLYGNSDHQNEKQTQCVPCYVWCILVKLDSNLVTLLFWGKKINGGWTFELMICEMCFCLFFISLWKPPSLPTRTQIRIEWYCNSTLDHHIIIIIKYNNEIYIVSRF